MALTRTVTDYKDSVKAATIGANINLAAAPNTLDGVSLVLSDRVLVKDQTPSSLNGIYRVTTLGTGSNGSWTRAADFNDYRQISSGALTFVEQGTISGNIFYYIPGGEPNVTVGSTAITFANLFSTFDSTVTLQSATNYGNTTTNSITISNIAPATSTTSGALIVSGGVGIGGNLYVSGNLSVSGNTTFFNTSIITTSDTIAAPAINAGTIGNTGAALVGTISTNAQPYVTSVGTLTNLTTSGVITAQSANVYAANLIGNTAIYGAAFYFANGTPFTSSSYGNTQVAAYLPTYTGNIGSGNISTGAVYINSAVGNYNVLNISGAALAAYGTPQTWKFFTNNTALGGSPSFIVFPDSSTQTTAYPGTSTTLSLSGTISASTINAGTIGNSGATLTGTLSTAAQTNITSVGTLTSLNSTGTIAAPTVIAATIGNAGAVLYGTLNSQSASQTNITSVGQLTSLNVTGTTTTNQLQAGLIGNASTTLLQGTLITAAQGNITSVGTLTSLTSTGTIAANQVQAGVLGNSGALITGTLTTAAQANITSVGTLGSLTVSGTTNLQGTTNGATINATTVQGGTIGNSGATFTGATQTLTSTSQAASFTTSGGGQLTGYHTGAIGANSANSGAFTTLTASGNTTLNNYANIYIATGSISQTSALTVVGNVYGQGGIGYLDFLKLQNTYSAATNPNKFLRLDNAGTIQIINSAYTNNIFNLTDAGDLTVPGKLTMSTGVFWSNGAAYSSGGGGSTSPGGANTMVQFNNSGSFAGATYLQYNITSGNLVSNSTTTSTSTTTGALVISGGVGIGGNINGGSNGTSTAQHNLLSGAQNAPTAGSILVGAHTVFSGAGSNYLTQGQYPAGSTINTIGVGFGQWLQSGYSGNATYYPIILNPLGGTVVVGSGTNSTSTTSGALAVYGGIGVSGNLYVGGNLSIAGNTTFINTQTITTTDTIAAPIISANVVGNVGSSHYGTIATNAQPFITSVGTLTGLISSANITAQTANVYAAYVVANSGIQGTLITNAQTNITSVGTLTSLTTSGNITAQTANIYAGNIISNTALITTSTTASNSTTTGALLVSGGIGVGANVYVGGNIYTQQRTGYTYNGNNTSVAYTYYNATTNSIDTVFG